MRFLSLTILFFTIFPLYAKPLTYTLSYKVHPFHTLIIKGFPTLHLITETSSQVKLHGSVNAIHAIQLQQRPDILIINASLPNQPIFISVPSFSTIKFQGDGFLEAEQLKGPLNIQVDGKGHLTFSGINWSVLNFINRGTATVLLKGVRGGALKLYQLGTGQIYLYGYIIVNSLTVVGKGSVVIQWINNNNQQPFTIEAVGNSHIYLAGVATEWQGILKNQSVLDTRFLRTQKIFLKTFNNASARVYALQQLGLVAADNSTISYTQAPTFTSAYTSQNGAIWNQALLP